MANALRKTKGIQPGQVAASIPSRKLDKAVKRISEEVFERKREELQRLLPENVRAVRAKSFSSDRVRHLMKERGKGVPGEGVSGSQPDAGYWCMQFPDGFLLPFVTGEGKYQHDTGNAGERAFKNVDQMRIASPFGTGFMFMAGEAASDPQSSFRRQVSQVLVSNDPNETRHWEQTYIGGYSCFANPSDDVIAAVMESSVVQALKHVLAHDDLVKDRIARAEAALAIEKCDGIQVQLSGVRLQRIG